MSKKDPHIKNYCKKLVGGFGPKWEKYVPLRDKLL
jgi:hypothetical protein